MCWKIYIIGTGAIGGLIGSYLVRRYGKDNISFIEKDEEQIEAIRKNKLRVLDEGNKLNLEKIDVNIFHPNELKCELENILLCTKAYNNHEALSLIPDTARVLVLQNGYDERLNVLENLTRGIEFGFACKVQEPGFVYNAVRGKYALGKLYTDSDLDVKYWSNLLGNAGIRTKVSSNIEGFLWSKLLINSALNPVSAITGYSFSEIVDDSKSLMLFRELYMEGYPIVKERVNTLGSFITSPRLINLAFKNQKLSNLILRKVASKYGAVESSMLQDVKRGRLTEIDYINGQIIKLGREFNLPTPLNSQITTLVNMITFRKLPPNPKNIFYIIR